MRKRADNVINNLQRYWLIRGSGGVKKAVVLGVLSGGRRVTDRVNGLDKPKAYKHWGFVVGVGATEKSPVMSSFARGTYPP